jgi:thymidylate synthase ThyX
MTQGVAEEFSSEERFALQPYFTNLDRPVFALRNLPEVVKAALFARYSRSPKSLRRLFLDEFLDGMEVAASPGQVGIERSEKLFQRVLSEYGDDSVAQLGGAHIAVEGASNVLTKVLEWGRLMAYLEQSTRYIPYTDRSGGVWRYVVPTELDGSPLRDRYVACLDRAFETYSRWIDSTSKYFESQVPREEGVSAFAYKATIRAKALDTLRGLLPAATRSNVGIFASGQAYELLLLRMRAHPIAEVRDCAAAMLVELREVIPAFLTRVDRPDRGDVWSRYLTSAREATERIAQQLLRDEEPAARDEVTLTDYDPEGELKVVAAALYAASTLPDDQILACVRRMSVDERSAVLRAYVGERANRRHKPGRAFERTSYRFDILADYGAFRDLQRHRLLTLEWQRFTPDFGYATPPALADVGAAVEWEQVMGECAELYGQLVSAGFAAIAAYALPMAYRVRFYMDLSAREAMHVIELRTTPQGHPAYRLVCQRMHRLIDEKAGHHAIAAAMRHVDHSAADRGRLDAERATEKKQLKAQS